MADRYWVGGTGTWDATAGTKWATTSGGAGGVAVPTSADNVFFDAASGASTVTVSATANCANLVCTGFTGTLAGGSQLNIYGSLAFSSTMTVSHTGLLQFLATTSGKTIDFVGKTKSSGGITFNGIGGEWTLLSDITLSTPGTSPDGTQTTLTNGTLNTNGYTLNFGRFSATAGTLNLGSSTLNCTSYNTIWSVAAGVTVNAGTSTLNVSVLNYTNTSAFVGAGKTYYNVNIIGTRNQLFNVLGANTFSTLSVTAPTSTTYLKPVTFDSTQTIGTLTTSGTTAEYRVEFRSSVAGTQRTLSVATIGTLTNTNFKDINLTGAASPWTAPLGVFDLGNNSGITFDTTTLYRIVGAGDWNDGTRWSTSSGGSAANAAPGPNNSVIINSSSGTGTFTSTGTNYCNDFTIDNASSISWAPSTYAVNVYGSLSLSASGTYSMTYFSPTFRATTTGKTITMNGKAVQTTSFNGVGGEWTFQDSCAFGFTSLVAGSLITNNNTFTCYTFNFSGTGVRSLDLGSSTVNFYGGLDATTTTNLTFNAGTSTINMPVNTGAATNFYGGGLTYNNISISDPSSYTINISGNNTIANLTLTGFALISANQIITGTFTVSGTSATNRSGLASSTFNTQKTITANAVSLTNVDFYGIIGDGSATWSGTSIGNASLNSNISFTTPKTVYWNLAAGGSWAATAWATSSGGSPAIANYPLPQDTAIIENTGLNTSASISVIASYGRYYFFPNIDFSTRTNAATFNFAPGTVANPYFCGNITTGSGITYSGTQPSTFLSSTTLTSAGKTWTSPITVAAGATLTIADTFSYTNTSAGFTNNGTLSLNADASIINQSTSLVALQLNGTTNLNGFTLTSRWVSLGASSVTNFGTGKIVSTGYSGNVFSGSNTQTVTGTPVVELGAPAAASNGRAITAGSPTEANAITFKVTAGTDPVTIGGNVRGIDFTGFSGSLSNGARTIYGDLTVSSGMTLTGGSSATTFAATSGTKAITSTSKTLDFPIIFNGVGGAWQLADNLTMGSTRAISHTNGTIDLNGKTLSCSGYSTNTGTKNITFNGGVFSLSASFANNASINFSTTAGTGTGKISMTSATAKTFAGGGSTYNCTLEQAGAGALTITGSNTFNDITNTTQPVSVLFTAGTTNTFNNFSLSGTSGNLVTIGSVTAASHTLSKSTGIVSVNYCTISRSTATGGALWQAYTINGNVDGGNNSGWAFSAASSGNGLFFGSNF